jgi:transposase
MIRIDFTPEEIKALDYQRYHHPHPKVQRKMEALWLKSQGLPHHQISRLTGISLNTLRAYLRQYQTGGIQTLKQLNYHPAQSELACHKQTIEDDFKEHPPATIKEAAERIYQLTGIRRSETRVRLFLKSIGIKRMKVGHIPAKADVEAQEAFKKKTYSHASTKPPLVRESSFSSTPPILSSPPF